MMEHIIHYPHRSYLLKGLALAGALLLVARTIWSAGDMAPSGQALGAYAMSVIFTAIAALLGYICLSALFSPKPVLEVDRNGFSVMGRAKRSWEQFQAVEVKTLRIGPLPLARWVVVRAGKSKTFARRLDIRWTHMPAPAAEFAKDISAYAALAESGNLSRFAAMQQLRVEEEDDQSVQPFDVVLAERKNRAERRPGRPRRPNLRRA